jgi:simple sugar transport system ATP-binding protein
VLRAGKTVATVTTADATQHSLAELMVGREIAAVQRVPHTVEPGEPTLVVDELWAAGDRGSETLRGVSLHLRAGEILAIAGVAGNGQRELAETVTGMRRATRGTIEVGGRRLRGGDAREAIRAGVAHVPEDRLHTGVAPSLSIASNVVLKSYRGRALARGPLLRLRAIRDHAVQLIQRYDVRGGGPDLPARQLSGGNLQKVVLAREFEGEPRVLVVASPTRGLDVAAIETVHGYLRAAAAGGVGILLISEDLDEIRSLADRVAVMYEGAIVGEVDPATASVAEIGLLMAGGRAA